MELKDIKDNSIIIVETSAKRNLIDRLSKINPFLNIKYLSKKDLKNGIYYTTDVRGLIYLKEKYNLSYANSKEILDIIVNLNIETKDNKELLTYKKELEENNLLIKDKLFINLFKNKNVYIYGYSKLDKELTHMLDSINVKYTYIIDESKNYKPTIYQFDTLDMEVTYLFNSIAKLIKSGIDPKNIKLYKYPSEYSLELIKNRDYFNLPIRLDEKTKLSHTPLYLNFIKDVKKTNDIKLSFKELEDKTENDPLKALDALKSIIVSLNDIKLDNDKKMELIEFLASTKSLKLPGFKDEISLIDFNSSISDNDYVFMIGFDIGSYPTISKDDDIISDYTKQINNQLTSKELNYIKYDNLKTFISNTKNLVITHKQFLGKKEYYVSELKGMLDLPLEIKELDNIRYSLKQEEIEVAKYNDIYQSYAIDNKYIKSISINDLKYKSYSHEFKDDGLLYNNKITLSYTSINSYNHCHFKYFCESVLRISSYDPIFKAKVGTLFHKILEDSVTKEVKLEDYNNLIDELFKTNKEKFFLNLLIPQVFDVVKKNNEFINTHDVKTIKTESKETIELDNLTYLTGSIDKYIVFDNNDLIIIDYKTGENVKFEPDKIRDGFSLQLPIYAILLENQDYNLKGVYIQNILSTDKTDDEKYMLNGLTSKDPSFLNEITKEIEPKNSSKYITGVKKLKDGSISIGKEFDTNIIEKTKIAIRNSIENLRLANFKITPTAYENSPLPCQYCEFRDVCFKTPSDNVIIEKEEEE